MNITPKRLFQAQLPGSASIGGGSPPVLYTVGAGKKVFLKDLNIANGSGNDAQVFLYIIPAGSALGMQTAFLPGITVGAAGVAGWQGSQVLEAGDTVAAYASNPGVTITASGAELQ